MRGRGLFLSAKSLSLNAISSAPAAQRRSAPDELELDVEQVRAAQQNPEAFNRLVERYMGRVYAATLRVLGQPADAHDAAQETFLRAWRALDRFQVGRPFGPWVCTIALNVARDHLRCPHRRSVRFGLQVDADDSPSLPATGPQPDGQVASRDRQEVLAAAIAQLKPRLREALVLRFVRGLSVQAVARALNIGESAAKMRLKRGLEQLRTELNDDAWLL